MLTFPALERCAPIYLRRFRPFPAMSVASLRRHIPVRVPRFLPGLPLFVFARRLRVPDRVRRFLPFSAMSLIAAAIALTIAWEPEKAEANRPSPEKPILRTSILDTGATQAPDCPHAVWPNLPRDCLLYPNTKTPKRDVRPVVIDDSTVDAKRAELRRIAIGL